MKKINQQNNLSIFDCFYPNFKIEKPIRLIELFAGYGSQALSLKYLGINFQHWFVSEIDKYAIDTYNKFNNTNFETCDIKNIHAKDLNIVETNKYNYILTYSFPCTDLSLAGKREGMEKGSGTRSSLLFEVERILKEIKDSNKELPQVLTSKGWDQWYFFLESLGYKNYIEILNSKDFYIPQNRERCFMVSILGNYNYNFPKHVKLKYLLKDYLEENVDEKYYLSEKQIKCLCNMKDFNGYKRGKQFLKNINREIATTITASGSDRSSDNFICEDVKVVGKIEQWHQRGFIYDENGICPTLLGTDYKTPKLVQQCILIPEKTKLGYAIAEEGDGVYINRPHQKRDVVQKGIIQTIKTSPDDIGVVVRFLKKLKIRKLTPKECYRLMGVKDEEINKVTVSNAQQYKQAGNSIVISVLMAIFGELLDVDYETKIKQIYDYQK